VDRQEILEALEQRIRASGGRLVQTVKSLADDLGVKPERLYYLIRAFEQKGQITTISHGPNGMELRSGSAEPTASATPARAGGRRRAGAASPAGTPAGLGRGAGASRFCPYCGREAQPDWRFCASCGRELPAAR